VKITVCILERFCRLVICLNINDFAIGKSQSFKHFSIEKNNFFIDDGSFVNLMVARNESANSVKLLISVTGMVHTQECHQCIFSKEMVSVGL